MGDMADGWDALKDSGRARRERNLAVARSLAEGWTEHTEHHWSRQLAGKRLDYWPSRNRFRYEGRTMTGDVYGFIRKRETAPSAAD